MNKKKITIISFILLTLSASMFVFFNASMKRHPVNPFPDSKGGTCYAKVFATVDTCIENCHRDENFVRNTTDRKYGYIIGRSSVRKSKGASWATIYRHARMAANACYKNAREALDIGHVYNLNDPELFQKTNFCSPKYQQAPQNTEEQKGYKRWAAYSSFEGSNIHGLIGLDFCRGDIQAIKYKLKYRSRSSKIKKSKLNDLVKKTGDIIAVVANLDGPADALCTAVTAGEPLTKGACNWLLDITGLAETITKYFTMASKAITGFVDGIYVSEAEGKAQCKNDYTRGNYIIQCGGLTEDLRPIPLPTCDIEEEKENYLEQVNESQYSLKDGQYWFESIHLRYSDRNCPTGFSSRGTKLLCKGTAQELYYKPCVKYFDRRQLIENHKQRLIEKCIEAGNINCEVREGVSCVPESVSKNKVTRSSSGSGIELKDLRPVAERMGGDALDRVEEYFERERVEFYHTNECSPFLTEWHGDCKYAVEGGTGACATRFGDWQEVDKSCDLHVCGIKASRHDIREMLEDMLGEAIDYPHKSIDEIIENSTVDEYVEEIKAANPHSRAVEEWARRRDAKRGRPWGKKEPSDEEVRAGKPTTREGSEPGLKRSGTPSPTSEETKPSAPAPSPTSRKPWK